MPDLRGIWRQLTRERDTVFAALDATDLGFAADAELRTIIDCVTALSMPGREADLVTISRLAAAAEVVVARQTTGIRPAPSRKRWRADVATVTREGQTTARTEPAERLRKTLEPPTPEPAAPIDNVVPLRPQSGRITTGREWVSQRSRSGESATRGLQDETF